MNTFTFTDDEVNNLIGLINSATGIRAGSPFLAIKEKLERKPKYIIGECGGSDLNTEYKSKGITFSVSELNPETFDADGFKALEFTVVGDVTDYGDFDPPKEK